MKRIVIKVGSNVLTHDDGKLDICRISNIVYQIVCLKRKGYDVILVTSGAVACGRNELKIDHKLDSVEQRQLFSAMGQVKLMTLYYNLFREYGIHIGQVLTMKENFLAEKQYTNQKACMEVMMENGVVPIVNENDTVSITELMFTDNDELSGLIAKMMNVDALFLLSNIDGLYTGNPEDKASKLIRTVRLDDGSEKYINSDKSSNGRGGMESKFHTARVLTKEGVKVFIANGKKDNIIIDILEKPAEARFTEFVG